MAGVRSLAVRCWKRMSLMQRPALVALVPTLVTAGLLMGMLASHRAPALRDMAQTTAIAIARQAAAASAGPMRHMQRQELQHIAAAMSELPRVIHVRIRAADGNIVADSNGTPIDDEARTLSVVRNITDATLLPHDPPLGTVQVDMRLGDAITAQRSIQLHTLIAWLVGVIITAEIGWLAAPQITAAMHRLGRSGRDAGTKPGDSSEWQNHVNHAAQALFDVGPAQALFEAQRDMEKEIEQATEELARKNAALEASSVAKARFLAAASHDLRQPLYALTLFSSSLAIGEHDPERLDRIMHIQECVAALDHLFSELLDLSRLETGAMQIEYSAFPLDAVFQEVSRNFRLTAEQQGLRLIMRTTDLWVRTDRTMLARILNNLVSNALRYTRKGGVLVAARRRHDDTVRVDVWDTGAGIEPEHQTRVFDEFYRVDCHSTGHEHGPRRGLGLGLATVQRLAELLGTPVRLKSRHGSGSVFSFYLRVIEPQPTHGAHEVDEPWDVAGMRVMVIDDEPAIVAGIRLLLSSWGCEVAVAEDPIQAVQIARNWPRAPDLVISDLQLRNGVNGLDVLNALERVYNDGSAESPPFARLLITGDTRSDRMRDILRARIPVLYKPVSPAQLREAMVSAWSASRGNTGTRPRTTRDDALSMQGRDALIT